MGMLFDYFVCTRKTMLAWKEALLEFDEVVQQRLEGTMDRLVTLKTWGYGSQHPGRVLYNFQGRRGQSGRRLRPGGLR